MAGNKENTDQKKVDLIFFLGSSDNPGTVITPIQLRGPNYDEWARAIRTSLQAKRKFGFIEGTIPKPTTPEKLEHWVAVHSMLVAWLLNTIEPSLRSTLSYYDDAQALWTHLKQRFCVINGTRICQLKAALSECKQSRDEDVSTYFGRLSRIWDDLTTYVKTPTCKCGGCTCNIATQVTKLRDEEYVHQFLLGLDNAYNTVRSQLLAQEPLPNIEHAYQRVVHDESLRRSEPFNGNSNRENLMAFKINVDGRNKHKITNNSEKTCAHCHQDGHDETTCFQIHGYSEWWNDRPRGRKIQGRGNMKSSRTESRNKNGITTTVRAHKVISNSSNNNLSNIVDSGQSSNQNVSGLAGITASQWQQILDLMNVPKSRDRLQGKNIIDSWLIDTGASNHVTGNLHLLTKVTSIPTYAVGLPDGTNVPATQEGSVLLNGGLHLRRVLYVPQLNCNLISVTQLIDDFNCDVHFTNSLCVIQDRKTRTLIGAGERKDGLYFFRGIPKANVMAVTDNSTNELWHNRLGHPSEKVLKYVPGVRQINSGNKQACDICWVKYNKIRVIEKIKII